MKLENYIHKKDLIGQLAVFLHCSPVHIEKRVLVRSDFPAPYKIGAQKLFKIADVEKWVEAQKVKRGKKNGSV